MSRSKKIIFYITVILQMKAVANQKIPFKKRPFIGTFYENKSKRKSFKMKNIFNFFLYNQHSTKKCDKQQSIRQTISYIATTIQVIRNRQKFCRGELIQKYYHLYKKLIKQNYNQQLHLIRMLQFNGIESQKNPLRVNKQFYQPHDPPRVHYHKKNFHHHKSTSPILDIPEPNSVIKYVSELDKVKHLRRQFHRNQLYYPDPQKNKKRFQNMYSTIHSRKKSLGFFEHKTIQSQRNDFMKTFRAKSTKKQEMNLSFYNTTSKSKFFMQKFHDDKNLTERSTPTFQNMLHRTVVIDDIMSKLKQNERKFVKGF